MPEDDDLPRLLSGRYRLEATLGHGGMGVVYRGVDLMMKRPIAVKLIRTVDGVDLDDEIAGRFLREAKNTARLQHEHIIEVFDLGRSDEGMYFVMELLEGESLSARLRREGALSPETTVHIGRQICEALQVAHTIGIVHRDLKPANVMLLERAGDHDYVKVLDFGVAKSVTSDQETQLTHTGMLVGTVDYMAPEQIMGKQVDGRTDVYALGVVLYKMLSGKAPFRDGGVPALIHAHLNTMPKPLIEVTRTVPNELDRVVLRCLAKSPERRYESMAELGRALTLAIKPDSVGKLMSLEYGSSSNKDPYDADDQTAIGRSYADAPLPLDDLTYNESNFDKSKFQKSFDKNDFDDTHFDNNRSPALDTKEPSRNDRNDFDDATVKMDRPLELPKPTTPQAQRVGLPMTPRGGGGTPPGHVLPPPPAHASEPRGFGPPQQPINYALPNQNAYVGSAGSSANVNLPYPEDISTAKRLVPDEITRVDRTEAKTCAMCQTPNAPHARACLACGISLSKEDQEAVRARVRAGAPRTASSPAPPMGPPISNTFELQPHQQHTQPLRGQMPSAHSSGPYGPPTPMHGIQAVQWLPHQPAPQQPTKSMWQRFLRWTGLG